MRISFAFNRLNTVIMTSLAFLILSAMLLTHLVTARLTERDLLDAHVERGRLLIKAVGIMARDKPSGGNFHKSNGLKGTVLSKNVLSLLETSGFSGIRILNSRGKPLLVHGDWHRQSHLQNMFTPEALLISPQSVRVDFFGTTWGLFWRAPKIVTLESPFVMAGDLKGTLTVFSDLEPLYSKIRASEPVILAYITLNAIILFLFGIYLLSRTVVRPIRRLVAVTERYDGDIPVLDKDDLSNNEIGQLSRSLNQMLRQLDANERKLRENISSLKAANQEIRRTQDEMVASEKMASVGRLATGLAHEIGNPLGIMLGYIELLKREDLTGIERKDFLERMESEMTRIHGIIRDLLDFSRPSPGADEKAANAHNVLEEVLDVIGPQPLFEKCHIERALSAESVCVKVSKDLLKQVFLNIIMNAADAMVSDGLKGDESEAILTIESLNEEGLLVMRFSDRGCGMNPEDLNRVFDPFFTTKSPGKGTGLGLSICYTIMERIGGRIRVQSEPGRGTTVTLEIPILTGESEEAYCA